MSGIFCGSDVFLYVCQVQKYKQLLDFVDLEDYENHWTKLFLTAKDLEKVAHACVSSRSDCCRSLYSDQEAVTL